jgi:hypothetical protein
MEIEDVLGEEWFGFRSWERSYGCEWDADNYIRTNFVHR